MMTRTTKACCDGSDVRQISKPLDQQADIEKGVRPRVRSIILEPSEDAGFNNGLSARQPDFVEGLEIGGTYSLLEATQSIVLPLLIEIEPPQRWPQTKSIVTTARATQTKEQDENLLETRRRNRSVLPQTSGRHHHLVRS